MAHNSLAMYNVYVTRARRNGERVNLDKINAADFFDIVEGFCNNLKRMGLQSDEALKRSFSADEVHVDRDGRWIYGRLTKGDFGTRRDVFNRLTGEKSKELEEDEVVPEPFYYGFYIPRGDVRGFLILQRIGAIGVLSEFHKEMKANIDQTVIQNHYFDIFGAVSGRIIDELYRNGKIHKVTFIRKAANTRDLFDGMGAIQVNAEMTVKAERGKSLPFNELFVRTRERGRRVSDIIGVKGFEFGKATAEIEGLGKKWTVDLSHWEDMLPYYLLEDVATDERGYPQLEAVHAFAKELVTTHIEGEMER